MLMHFLLLQSLLWGNGSGAIRRPDVFGDGANALGAERPADAVMVLLNAPGADAASQRNLQPVSSMGRPVLQTAVQVAAVDPMPAPPLLSHSDGDRRISSSEAAEDAALRAELAGRYQGQIRDRIERAWVRPRDRLQEGEFRCAVKVIQDHQGNVKEVEVVKCPVEPRWLASLATAIQSASPLPAPPDPSVYSDAITLAFTALEYSDSRPADGYEVVAHESPSIERITNPQYFDGPRPSENVQLTISGGKVSWTATATGNVAAHP